VSEIEGIKHQISFNKSEKTVSVTTTVNGKKTVLTIWADSGDKNNTRNNSIFDANDKITVSDGNGNKVSDAKLDAGLISKLLSAINGQTIEQASEIKNVKASGKLFDPTSFENNGITRSITTAGSLCDAAIKAGTSFRTNGTTTTSTGTQTTGTNNNGGPYYVPPTYGTNEDGLDELRARYSALHTKKAILQKLANLIGQSQMYINSLSNPLAGLQAQTFAANGFRIAALLSMPNNPTVKAFENSAGLSIQDAIKELNAEAAAINAELNRLGKTEQDLTQNINVNGFRQLTPGHVENPPAAKKENTTTPSGMSASGDTEKTEAKEPQVTISVEGTSTATEEDKDLDIKELNTLKNGLSADDMKALGIKNLNDLQTRIEKIFEEGSDETKNALTKSIRNINDLKKELGSTSGMSARSKLTNKIEAEVVNLKAILNGGNNVQPQTTSSTPQTSGTNNGTAVQPANTAKPEISLEDFNACIEKLGLDDKKTNLIRNMLKSNLPDDKKRELIALLKRAEELTSDDNIATSSNQAKSAILKTLDKFINANSKEVQDKNKKIELDANDIAKALCEEITDTWFDRDKFEEALNKITGDNILAVLDAYEKTEKNPDKESLWKAIQGEWMTTAKKKEYYDKIIKSLDDCAKNYGIDIETDEQYRDFKNTYKTEFSKTGLFDGDTKEGEVRFKFEAILARIRNLKKEKEA